MFNDFSTVIIVALLVVIVALVASQVGARIERRKSQPKPTTSRLEATAVHSVPSLYETPPRPKPPFLSGREWEIAQLAAQGMSNKEIAMYLAISENTVATHMKNCYRKLEVSSRVELARRLRDMGVDPLSPPI
jgi:DNA-binding NarL/FixJ family response regulator